MKCIGNIWYASFAELTVQCGLSQDTVKQGISRNLKGWQSISDPDDRRKRLVRYDTLADKYQAVVRKRLCGGLEPGEMKARKSENVLIERSLSEQLDIALKEGYRRYTGMYPATDTTREAQRTQTSLARAAAVIELIGNYIQ